MSIWRDPTLVAPQSSSCGYHMLRRLESETERMLDELADMLCRYLVADDG